MGRGGLAAPGRRLVLSSILPSHRPGINHSFLWGSNILRNIYKIAGEEIIELSNIKVTLLHWMH